MNKVSIVIGLGYGDEGKGITTDFLCQQGSSPLVVRFSGGHQAGHTVVDGWGRRHVFSSFGSGSLRAVPAYWSRYCTFYPVAFLNEWEALKKLAVKPKLFVDARCPVTTPYDVFYNRFREQKTQHGSCGVGFGATVERSTTTPYQLYVQDLFYPVVLKQKLQAIGAYYVQKSGNQRIVAEMKDDLEIFQQVIEEVTPLIEMVEEKCFVPQVKDRFDHWIFEGSQGILLDQDHGFFPNVTRAYTTSRNAVALIERYHLDVPDLYYVTRAYQTRHGNGFLSNETIPLDYRPNPNETNQYNEWQGRQRVSRLDLDLLDYALQSDRNYAAHARRHLVVTCLDQLEGPIPGSRRQQLIDYSGSTDLAGALGTTFESVIESYADCSDQMRVIPQLLATL